VGGFFSVSPFAVTGWFDVGDVDDEPFMLDESLMPDGFDPVAMCALSLLRKLSLYVLPLMLEPLLSVAAGATDPPAVDVSVALVLSPLAHAASKARTATIAMRFMNPPER
jgi:hypothetical protein